MSSLPAPLEALPHPSASESPPVVVRAEDLLRTDLVLEAGLAHVRRRPSSLLHLAGWRLRGRAYLGEKLAEGGALHAASLPMREELLSQIQAARAQGHTVTLTGTAPPALLDQVASHLELPFEATAAHGQVRPASKATSSARAWVRALRPHQWVKNALVLLPPLLGHAASEGVWLRALLAFVAFCLCASSVYLLNDLLDLQSDRAHARKRTRPFASGALPLGTGLIAAPLLLVCAFALALWVLPAFAAVLGAYYGVTLAYSLVLKRVALLDVLLLAGLYTLRIIGGGVATGLVVSEWLLGFSLFLFTSLAFVKRYSELHALRRAGREDAHGRGYRAADLELLQSLGPSAGYLAVLVFALYVSSDAVTRLYTHPERLWALVPLLLYWVSRVWLIAHRGHMHDDPIVFAIRDRASYAVLALAAVCVAWAI